MIIENLNQITSIIKRDTKSYLPIFYTFLLLSGFFLGILYTKSTFYETYSNAQASALRLDSEYELINPLLVCNTSFLGDSPSLTNPKEKIENLKDEWVKHGHITMASVYYRDLDTGSEFSLNPEEEYYPASIKKLPLMMQYYKESQTDPDLLTTRKPITLESDYNLGTTIKPKQSPIPGKEYTAQELIEMMIKHSDNNSFAVLYPALGQEKFDRIYEQMRFDFPNSYTSNEDYITTYDLSIFFRTLYNSTYLNRENSIKALELLTQTDYTQGLVRYLPSHIKVAHKYGIAALTDKDNQPYGELHDCGIIYHSPNPYLLCIMTKSESPDVSKVEDFIAEVSKQVYYDHSN